MEPTFKWQTHKLVGYIANVANNTTCVIKGTTKIKLPVFAGDTTDRAVSVESSREISQGGREIVITDNDIINLKGETVIFYRAVRIMAEKPEQQPTDVRAEVAIFITILQLTEIIAGK